MMIDHNATIELRPLMVERVPWLTLSAFSFRMVDDSALVKTNPTMSDGQFGGKVSVGCA